MEWASATRWLGRRVLVTGASGFLGGAVARLLLELGAEVHGTGSRRLPPDGVVAHPMRLPDEAGAVLRAIRPEVVFHLACPVDLRREPALYDRLREGILDGTAAVASAAMAMGARLVHVGTCDEYGAIEVPYREIDAGLPVSPYAALKAAASAWVLGLSRYAGLEATVIRPFRGYGPGDLSSLVALAGTAALRGEPFAMTDGAQIREWNAVHALAEGIVAAGAHPDAPGRVINVGGGERASVLTVVQTIFRIAGADPALIQIGALPRRLAEVERLYGDHGLARSLWGEIEQPSLEEGLADTLDWLATEGAA